MTIVSVDTPGSQHTLHIAIVPGASNVIHDLVPTILHDGGTNLTSQRFQHFFPGCAFPLALAALPRTLEWIKNTLGVVDLINSGWSLRTVAPTTARMIRIPLESPNSACPFINIG